MLQYIDNVDYGAVSAPTIDEELAELSQLLRDGYGDYELYLRVKTKILKEIKYHEMGIIRILTDLREIREKNKHHADIIEELTINNMLSYNDLGKKFNVSKQRIHEIATLYRYSYRWLDNLLLMKNMDWKRKK